MKEGDFQEWFEGLYNDYEFQSSKGMLFTWTLRKMHKLIGEYLKAHDEDLYKDKGPQNGAD